MRQEILARPELLGRIRAKYRMKNTTGYSLNAFVDYQRPVDIFAHVLIGSEGTLAFIAEAVLDTVPVLPFKSTGLLFFPNIHAACDAIAPFRDAGARALELMDSASLRAAAGKPGMPASVAELPPGAAALLCEFQAAREADLPPMMVAAESVASKLPLLVPAGFSRDAQLQEQYWRIREGLFPTVGGVRQSGTTVIIEDVCFPIERLADAAVDLQQLFRKHRYDNAIIFGHAKDGNLHFVITQSFNDQAAIDQYAAFIEDMVALVVNRHGGALKAEHGTGRNMAPFVETEWGPEAAAIMRRLKALADPEGLLNPGVIIAADSRAHLRDLKSLPSIEPEADMCIECGYCEPVCPSRELTLTPRQRIVVRREMVRQEASAEPSPTLQSLSRDFRYSGLETCAGDGMCQTRCPVSIDTGALTKRLRARRHSPVSRWIARTAARHAGAVEHGGACRGRHRPRHGRGGGDPGHAGHHRGRARHRGDGVVPPVERGRAPSRPGASPDLGCRRAGRLFPGLHGADVRPHRRRTGSAQRTRGPGRPGPESLRSGPHPRGHHAAPAAAPPGTPRASTRGMRRWPTAPWTDCGGGAMAVACRWWWRAAPAPRASAPPDAC